MRRHPVDQHADARLVERVDQILKIVGGSEAARGRIESGDLITPRGIESVLGHRQKLDMRETHLPHVVGQRHGHLAVTPRFGHRLFPPRTEMNFVHAHWQSKWISFGPLLQPFLIGPGKLPIVPRNRGVFRRRLKEKTIRIGFENNRSLDIPELIFVECALAHSGHE